MKICVDQNIPQITVLELQKSSCKGLNFLGMQIDDG